jgi:integrase
MTTLQLHHHLGHDQWSDVDLERRTLVIGMAKNGHGRTIPLMPQVLHLLAHAPRTAPEVLPMSQNAFRLSFERARVKAGTSFRFHDLRHEAISRFFELGLTAPEVRLISGHRTLTQLSRYSHPDVVRIADKLSMKG